MHTLVYPGEVGTPTGPCAPTCSHIICKLMRSSAAGKCSLCAELLGYGHEVFFSAHGGNPVHAACHHAMVEGKIASALATETVTFNEAGEETGRFPRTPSPDDIAYAEVLQTWLDGGLSNEEYNMLGLMSIHNSDCRVVTLQAPVTRKFEPGNVGPVKKAAKKKAG